MLLRELLAEERIGLGVRVLDRRGALEAVAARLASAAPEGPSTAAIVEVLAAREALSSTAIGSGVAVPHGRVPGLERFVGALVVVPEGGVAFDALDGAPVNLLFGLVGPERGAAEHLKCLARIARLLRDAATRERLRAAGSCAEALAVVLDADTG